MTIKAIAKYQPVCVDITRKGSEKQTIIFRNKRPDIIGTISAIFPDMEYQTVQRINEHSFMLWNEYIFTNRANKAWFTVRVSLEKDNV